jgi:threonine/homoserine/homoserine lactone efflux protein
MGGFAPAFLAFLVAALTMILLVFTLALLLATAQDQVARTLEESAPALKRWGGRILVLVGLWLLALAVFADFFAEVFPV